MAKKQQSISENIFKKTTPEETPAAEPLKGTNISVYLSAENRRDFEKIAEDLNVSVHYLLQTAAKQFLVRYAAGEIKTSEETITVIE